MSENEIKEDAAGVTPGKSEGEALLQHLMSVLRELEKLAAACEGGRKPDNPAVFLKIVTPLLVQVENSLPELRDTVDSLEYMGNTELATGLTLTLNRLEESVLPPLLRMVDSLRAEEKPREDVAENSASAKVAAFTPEAVQ